MLPNEEATQLLSESSDLLPSRDMSMPRAYWVRYTEVEKVFPKTIRLR